MLEVILKSGNFLNRELARRHQLWLVRDRFYKAMRRAGPWLLRDGPERFQAKACFGPDPGWIPVRVKKTRQNTKMEPRSDSIGTEAALAAGKGWAS
jgi:hypothetical protein